MLTKIKAIDEEIAVHVITGADEYKQDQQDDLFNQIAFSALNAGIKFTWEIVNKSTKHDRYITTDIGWKIILGRGLDIFQHYEAHDAFALDNRIQEFRGCKECSITYIKA